MRFDCPVWLWICSVICAVGANAANPAGEWSGEWSQTVHDLDRASKGEGRSCPSMTQWIGYFLRGLYTRAGTDQLFLIAGGLAFSLILCIVPFVLIISYVLGTLLAPADIEYQVNLWVSRALPYPAYADLVRSILIDRARELVEYRHMYGLTGAAGLLFTTSGLFASMRTVLNTVFRVADPHSSIVMKLYDFCLVFLVLVLFLVSVVALPAIEALQAYVSHAATVLSITFSLSSMALIAFIFYLLYRFVCSGRIQQRALLASSLAAMVLWELVEQIFGWYLGSIASMERLYGAYTAFFVVCLWIYYVCLAFIMAAQIGQLYRERLTEVVDPSRLSG